MNNRKKRFRGFTLVELIVVIAVFALLLAAALTMLLPLNNIYNNTWQYTDTQGIVENVRRVLEDDLRFADRMWVFTGVKEDDDKFIPDTVDEFRKNFGLGIAYPGRKPYATGEVYCIKINNPKSSEFIDYTFDEENKPGRMIKWAYGSDGSETGESKLWLINKEYFNEYSMSVTFRGTLDPEPAHEVRSDPDSPLLSPITYLKKDYVLLYPIYTVPSGINPTQFAFDVNIYSNVRKAENRANRTSSYNLCQTSVNTSVILSLTNLVNAGGYIQENWSSGTNTGDVTRFTYYDNGAAVGTGVTDNTDTDIYFFYTKPEFK